MKPAPNIPPAEDFDFRAIPLAEIKEAALWEYARTAPTVRAAAVRWLDAEVQGKTIRAHLQAAARKPYTGPGRRSSTLRRTAACQKLASNSPRLAPNE